MRLRSMFLLDMRFQAKYGFYLLYAILTVIYTMILFALPEIWREKAAALLIFSDPASMGLFFMGAIVLLEKNQHTPWAFAVSPVRPMEYVIAKVSSLSAISLVVAAILALAAGVNKLHIVLIGTLLSSVIFTLLAMIIATKIISLAAITIIIYSQFLLNTMYIGYSIGIAPIIGFNYGNGNSVQQKKVFHISMQFIAVASVLVFAISMFGGPYIVQLFTEDTSEVYRIAANGLTIFSCSFLFCGLNNFTTAMFTALSNGKVSAALSFMRTFGLLAGGILLLPRIWGITGVWLAVPIAEGIMFVVSVLCLIHYKRRYSY